MKHRAGRIALVALAALLLIVLVGPFLVPAPPLENTRTPQELADPDSQFIPINGLDVHVKTSGQGQRSTCCCTALAPACTRGMRSFPPSPKWAG